MPIASAQDGPDYVGRRPPGVETGVSSESAERGALPLNGLAIGGIVAAALVCLVVGSLLWKGADGIRAARQ